MEQDQQPSRAEQRMAAVAKLKRAASLPRMKDGRRPPMHSDAVSEGEKAQKGADGKADASPVQEHGEAVQETADPDVEAVVEAGAEAEVEPEGEGEVEQAERAVSPGPPARTKRRSRSRSRSRGSKDLRGKARATQSPTPTPQTAGDSSQDEAPYPPPLNLAALTPLVSPIPSHILELQRSRLLRSPTPTSPEPSMLNSGTLPQNPMLLPTLEAWQRGLFRSNSAGGSNAAGRMLAMHKLTGGTESYEPSGSSSPTAPPFAKLGRNNTVTGGERTAARQLMFSRLGPRLGKELDGDQVSGGEERPAPSPTPKRRRRRSRRGSQSANTGISDSEFLSTSPNTPTVPPTPLPATFDAIPDASLRSRSATPFQLGNPFIHDAEEPPEPPQQAAPVQEPERLEPTRRRSLVIEEDEEEQYIPQRTFPGLPSAPPQHTPAHIAALRLPHTSDAPSNGSSDSASPSAVSVPVYLSQRTPQRTPPGNDAFPRSPYATPFKEVSMRDDDEEQVLYHPDTYRPRTPYEDHSEREISWVATPVPELDTRMPVHDEEEDEDNVDRDEEEYQDVDEPPLSPQSSNDFPPPGHDDYNEASPRVSSSSKSLVVESEASPDASPSHVSLTPSAVAPSQVTSVTRASDGSTSPATFPMRLSVASRSPLFTEFSDWDDRAGNVESNAKRNGDSPSTWEKVKSTFSRAGSSSGRRSRTNSIVTRDRRDRADSINRESGASLNSAKTDKVDPSVQQQAPQPLMQSSSASASISSLPAHASGRGAPSPIPPLTPANKSKYQHAKLFPFGMAAPEEIPSRIPTASASSPDIIMQSSSNEEDPPFLSASNTPGPRTPEMPRERKLSHQTSDPHLVARMNPSPHSPSHPGTQPRSPSQNGGSHKLPMTLPGVKQWLSKNKKIFSSTPTSPPSAATPVPEVRPPPLSKQPSAQDTIRRKDSELLGTDWEEIGHTPTSTVGDNLLRPPALNGTRHVPAAANSISRSEHTDTEKTPKARKVMPPSDQSDNSISFFDDPALTPPSRPDPFSSATPDPSSSLSDYPAHSTSESSSTTSSQYSLGPLGPPGSIFLEKIDEELARGSRSRIWATSADDPPRKLLLATPVFQVVNHNTVKDRFLFLFSDILVIAKPVFTDQEAYLDKNPMDRKFIVKSVVQLSQLRFTDGRTETEAKDATSVKSRNRLVDSFVQNFAKDPHNAINSLCVRSGHGDDPVAVGQLLFKTVELDRVRLGEYLVRRSSKSVLRVYVDSFGFVGLRVDKALRVFLLSIHVPKRTSHQHIGLEYLLEAFAGRWYEANARLVDYNKDQAHRFVRAIVQLNDLLHGGIAEEPGPTEVPERQVSSDDFVDAFRRYDQKSSVSDNLLRDVYEAILTERLAQHPDTGSRMEPISIKRPIPSCLTLRIESEPIVLRISHTDPSLSIELYGQDMIFDPPVLNFGKSPEVSFRIKAVSLGAKSIIMRRSGPNALKYSGLPLSSPVLVERAFMRHTFQVAFQNHNGLKRRYMFSMDDSVLRHQWAAHIRRQMEKATEASSLGTSKFRRAAETLAFKVLQETMMGASLASIDVPHKAAQRLNLSPLKVNGASRFGTTESNGFQLAPLHVRSKSRSKFYHQHGAGKNEADPGQSPNHPRLREEVDGSQDHNEGPIWSTEELKMLCEQNGAITSLLSYLQVMSIEQGELNSL
ncbi:putative sec7 domain containing protein [Lyophyllum shimeji]|uniref:Sec7 domain containing protein n=1 Tax=Lyophyllum shimeji TaxID=47721 RepID=A0A9P3PJS3_LYOSH|nr:putative sec7 domain containing protein [Lyophyllum shimeji]